MKPVTIISALAALALVSSGNAAMSTWEWTFSTSANPSTGTPGLNPSGATALATVSGGFLTYFSGSRSGYGSVSGLWDISGGQVELALDTTATTALNLTLAVRQFVGDPMLFPAALSFSVPGAHFSRRDDYEYADFGKWVTDIYYWEGVNLAGNVSLIIRSADLFNPEILLDNLKLTVDGTLVSAVPEPSTFAVGVLLLIPLAVAALRGWTAIIDDHRRGPFGVARFWIREAVRGTGHS